jgi:predicted kinase
MDFYIILRGPAGVGKTTIAEKLSQIYNAHYIPIDKVKKRLGLMNSEQDKMEANKVVIEEAMSYLDQGKVVILDEVLYFENQLAQLEEMPYTSYLFSLNASLWCCLERNRKRRANTNRKLSDDTVKLVYGVVSLLKKGIEISNEDRTIDETVNEILSYLPQPK